METISSIQESDTSAIDRLEADRAKQRQDTVDAANIATRRAALLKTGLGIGAAASGIGLGGLLVFYGVSLILGRPTHEEMARALQAQAATIEKATTERIETIQAQAAGAVAAAQHEVAETKAQKEKAAAQARMVTEKFASSSTKTVVDFSVFRTQEINSLAVVTGWKYQKTDDPAPSHQWCYVRKISDPDGFNLPIATNSVAEPFNSEKAAKAGITRSEVQRALPYCDWFKGTNTNIHDSTMRGL